MTGRTNSIIIPLKGLIQPMWGRTRRREPVTVGIPLEKSACFDTSDIRLETPSGVMIPAQVRPLDHWIDGSIQWCLVDFQAGTDAADLKDLQLRLARGSAAIDANLRVVQGPSGLTVETGRLVVGFTAGGLFPFSVTHLVSGSPEVPGEPAFRLKIADRDISFMVGDAETVESGPLRVAVRVKAVPAVGPCPLQLSAVVELFVNSAAIRITTTLHNPARASHPNGQWSLGDPGSIMIRSAAMQISIPAGVTAVRCAAEAGASLETEQLPFEIYQESSGGAHWNAPVHKNRDGIVPMRLPGYRVSSGPLQRFGKRATPIVVAGTGARSVAATLLEFWQRFPAAIAVNDRAIDLEFLPEQFPDVHELQGGERISHTAVLGFGEDAVGDPPLAWCHDPARFFLSPADACATRVVPDLVPADVAAAPYETIAAMALDEQVGFLAKRERSDEFGWRHFGDLPADHESRYQPADQPFVSHYNNQYDPIAAFALRFISSGDVRWWVLMDDLARHVVDIDIYWTREDKAAYSGGLFWHTSHYTDAGTATHRTYPRGGPTGGGPAAEHNYNRGLMLHYFLTGRMSSRDAAVRLGQWVIDMDDGRLTPFRWLASGRTGVASATGSADYHGPGRGPANSILACRVAHRLTKRQDFAAKADELIRRCIHPGDDIAARDLLDVERRWYYTVFLQALGLYLQEKEERGEVDDMHGYARASLLAYAVWMAEHERPYLERPQVLEFPNETWVAQDLRKADALLYAARYADTDLRKGLLDRARFFFDYATGTLAALPERALTRPLVLLLINGYRFSGSFAAAEGPAATSAAATFPAARFFRPQKTVALRRAGWLAATLAAAFVMLAIWLFA